MDASHSRVDEPRGPLPGSSELFSPLESLISFLPLKLILQPSGVPVRVDRPDVVVGRHSEADIRLPMPDVSRRHCRLQFVEGLWQVVDLNSLNGVFVNGEQVLQAALNHGDVMRIGGFIFSVELGQATETPVHPFPRNPDGETGFRKAS